MVRDSCVERLFVCASALSLSMMSSHWCAPPSHSRKMAGRAVVGNLHLLQPAQFFVSVKSSEKSEVLVTVSVLDANSCGAETVPELVTSPHTAARRCSPGSRSPAGPRRLSRRSSAWRPSAAMAAKLAAVGRQGARGRHRAQELAGRPRDAQRPRRRRRTSVSCQRRRRCSSRRCTCPARCPSSAFGG